MEAHVRFFWVLGFSLFGTAVLFTFLSVQIFAAYISLFTTVYIAVTLIVPVKKAIFDFVAVGLVIVWLLSIALYAI